MKHGPPQLVGYRSVLDAPRRTRGGAFFVRIWMIIAAVHLAATLAPFAFVGDSWGMVWFVANLPLSAWAEDRWGIGSDSAGLILAVTLVNASVVATALSAVATAVRHAIRRRRPRA